MMMRNWVPALCAAVLVLGTGCGKECVDQFDCVNDKGVPPAGQEYACVNNKCELHSTEQPSPDGGTTDGGGTETDAGTDAGTVTDGGNTTDGGTTTDGGETTDAGTDAGVVLTCTPACDSAQECDTTVGTCVTCVTDAHCATVDASKPYCLNKTACVQCRTNAECGLNQVCNTSNACEAAPGPTASATSAQITTVLGQAVGTLSSPLPIEGAYVTYLKPAVGADVAGFFLQAEAAGPAVFVAADPGTLKVGDRINLMVGELTELAGKVKAAATPSNVTVISSSHPVQNLSTATPAGLAQDLTDAKDLVSSVDNYLGEIIQLRNVTVTGAVTSSGTGHVNASIATGGIPATGTMPKLRMLDTLANEIGLADKCVLTLDVGPVWKFVGTSSTTSQPSAYYRDDITNISCPAPQLLLATPVSSSAVTLTFDRPMASASLTKPGEQFTFNNNLTASAASANGREITVTTGAQTAGQSYTVSVANTVTDTLGKGVTTPNSASFSGYQSIAAHGGRLVVTGSGFTGATAVSIGGAAQAGFTVDSDTQITIPSVADATPVGLQDIQVTTTSGTVSGGKTTVLHLIISELDADQSGTDTNEFVEISTGVPNFPLSGFVLVFFNGGSTTSPDDRSYLALDLNKTTDAKGLLVAGNPAVTQTTSGLGFPNNTLQNGPDAVAIYQASSAAFPLNTHATSTGLIDAVVYTVSTTTPPTSAPDLLNALMVEAGRVMVNEAPPQGGGSSTTMSIQRCGTERRDGRVYKLAAPTPGAANTCP